MRFFLSAAGGLLLSTAAVAQTTLAVPEAAPTAATPLATAVPAAVKPPRLLHFSVGLGTGAQLLHRVGGSASRFGFTTGLSGIVGIGNRYELETGLLLAGGGGGGDRRRPDGALPDSAAHHGHHRGGRGGGGLAVPLKFNAFVWASGPLRVYVSGGVITNLHGRRGGGCHEEATTTTGTTTSETTTTTTATPRVAVAATAGFGVEYRPCGNLSIRLEPQGRFDLQSAGRTWGGGLRLGTFWNF